MEEIIADRDKNINAAHNAKRLRELQQLIKDRVAARRQVEAIFDNETENA